MRIDLSTKVQFPLPKETKMNNEQVKSKQRVADRGEVFTAEREVKAMCDLVKDETERIDSRFLEPACGDGNFLAEILRRKLAVVKNKYKKSTYDYEMNSVLAVASIYGVDIMHDNVQDCRERLFQIWNKDTPPSAKMMLTTIVERLYGIFSNTTFSAAML